ncbi:hypothetical protein EVAR_27760_1 [Eumeta japonica]|uniref:Uncharacterized protein n=1 Tax=Eumeta variegata TaxID=151549 RepID=A0A4C1VBD9_EUMVA|nr:hypothetical protein EVAR_27760_1 [Eumeta japonica]
MVGIKPRSGSELKAGLQSVSKAKQSDIESAIGVEIGYGKWSGCLLRARWVDVRDEGNCSMFNWAEPRAKVDQNIKRIHQHKAAPFFVGGAGGVGGARAPPQRRLCVVALNYVP